MESLIKYFLKDLSYYDNLHQPILFDDQVREYDELVRRKEAFNKLELDEGKLLDVGCNFGLNSFLLKEKYPYLKIDAIDIDFKAITIANMLNFYYNTNINFKVNNLNKISYKDYDYVLISFLPGKFLGFLIMYLQILLRKFKGKIILIYPNDNNKKSINNYKQIQITKKFFKKSKVINNYLIII